MMYKKMLGRKAGGAIALVAGLVMLATGMPGACALSASNDSYAVIFATPEGTSNAPINEGWAIHNWLLNHGWTHSHIKFLANHASADGSPSSGNLQNAIADIAANSTGDSLVFIAVLNKGIESGGQYYFYASNRPVSSGELGNWVDGITAYDKMAIEVSFRHSGGFITDLDGNDRVIVTSHAYYQNYLPNRYTLSRGLANGSDTDGDGYISLQEAHEYERAYLASYYPNTQTPQIHDDAGTVVLTVS